MMARELSERTLAGAAALRARVEMEYAVAAHKSADGEREMLTAMQERLQAEVRARDASESRIVLF